MTTSRPRIRKQRTAPAATDPLAVFGSNVRSARFTQGRTQTDLALAARVSPQHISRIEDGAVNITMATMARIAAALGVALPILLAPLASPDCDKAATPSDNS